MPARRFTSSSLIALVAAGAGLMLSGCLAHDPFAAPVDPQSAAAAQVREAAAKDLPYPRWADFPAAPENVPEPAEFADRVVQTEAAQAALREAAAGLTWTLEDTAGFLAETRAHIDPALAQPAPSDAAARTEAWAAEQRAKAVPPPVAK